MNEKAPNAQTQAAMTEARLMARTRDFKETVATRVQSALRGHGRPEIFNSDQGPTPACLAAVTTQDIEAFMRARGPLVGRGTLQHIASQQRGLLRFLALRGFLDAALAEAVDTPVNGQQN